MENKQLIRIGEHKYISICKYNEAVNKYIKKNKIELNKILERENDKVNNISFSLRPFKESINAN